MTALQVHHTVAGTPYLQEAGAVLLAYTTGSLLSNVHEFLAGFDPELGFKDYDPRVSDIPGSEEPNANGMYGSDALIKVAGQVCYMSCGPGHTPFTRDAGQTYLDNIKAQAHGSVLEHSSATILCWGIDRSVTHELVRHRAGMAYSQVSQRYVDGKVLRFVERPEYQKNDALHQAFIARIDAFARQYDDMAAVLVEDMKAGLASMSKRDARKAVNQAARSLLPNETEAPIVVTGNMRAWRHVLEMRASRFADRPIRALAVKWLPILRTVAPATFSDYEVADLPDGSQALDSKWRKV